MDLRLKVKYQKSNKEKWHLNNLEFVQVTKVIVTKISRTYRTIPIFSLYTP